MRSLGVLAALAALLGGLGGSGQAVQPSVAGPSAETATVAEDGQAARSSTIATPAQNIAPSQAVWRSYAWQPRSYDDRYERRWARDRPRRGNSWGNRWADSWADNSGPNRSWRDDGRSARSRAWRSPQQAPWRYGWQGDRRRESWGADNSRTWPRTWATPSPRRPLPNGWSWRNEPWRSDLRGSWNGGQRWVDSRGSAWRYR